MLECHIHSSLYLLLMSFTSSSCLCRVLSAISCYGFYISLWMQNEWHTCCLSSWVMIGYEMSSAGCLVERGQGRLPLAGGWWIGRRQEHCEWLIHVWMSKSWCSFLNLWKWQIHRTGHIGPCLLEPLRHAICTGRTATYSTLSAVTCMPTTVTMTTLKTCSLTLRGGPSGMVSG